MKQIKPKKLGKKGQGISFNVIVVAAIALIVLIVVIMIFTGKLRIFGSDVDEPIAEKICNDANYGGNAQCSPVCLEGYEEVLARTDCFDKDQQCCRQTASAST